MFEEANVYAPDIDVRRRRSRLAARPLGSGGVLDSSASPSLRSAALARAAVDLEVIIPALNEEHRLPETLRRTTEFLQDRRWSSAIVVVDNGSVDDTAEIPPQWSTPDVPVHVIGCARRGKGAAVRRAIERSSARYVGFTDADLATPIETLDSVMMLLEQGAAAVIGSRRAPFGGYAHQQSMIRRAGGSVFHRVFHHLVPDVADTQCGFKFFHGDVARKLAASCQVDGFVFDVELLAMVRRAGYAVHEVPVTWSDRTGSTFHAVHDGIQSLLETYQVARSLSRAPVNR
jgi:dolichyl-phosphate beta-glucosyltransferase